MILGIIVTICLEIFLPVLMGLAVALSMGEVKLKSDLFAMSYICGQVILFALFQPLFVYSIIKNRRFGKSVLMYIFIMLAVLICLLVFTFIKYRKEALKILKSKVSKPGLFGILAALILGVMIVLSFFMAYYDGDDSYYVAAATGAVSSDYMYVTEPYTGYAIESPYRYLFAPFPMWLGLLSKLSGIRVPALAHTFFPWSMILLCYAVMYVLSGYLFGEDKKKREKFMFVTSILIAFGDYSIHTPENFLLARSRQGKAALASFVLPFLVMLIFGMIREYDSSKKIKLVRLVMLVLTGFAGALCSTLGGVLCVSLTLTASFCMMLTYRKLKYPILMAICSMPCLVFPVLYFVMI